MEFISGGNIFLKNFSINLCKGSVILEGKNILFYFIIFFENHPPPPPPKVPYINFVSVLSGV